MYTSGIPQSETIWWICVYVYICLCVCVCVRVRVFCVCVYICSFYLILRYGLDCPVFAVNERHVCLFPNGLGKEVLSKQIVSLTYTILDQKQNPPIFLSWNSDLSHTDTLDQESVIIRTSSRTRKPPSTKTDDFLW